MPVIHHQDVRHEPFHGGATYQTLVGDAQGSTPVRLGIQTSPPGYATRPHAHPYMEILTILEGEGEGWIEGEEGLVKLEPGVTVVFPPNTRHGFRVVGDRELKTLGVHASPHRLVEYADGARTDSRTRSAD
jgi:quercetin dioxygenase-like cupin family protein